MPQAFPENGKKCFVLDTNVILHDSSCLHHFEDNDIVVPICVLEELDQFKKGSNTLNFHAREFVRALDSLSGGRLFDGGVPIGPDSGKIAIKLEQRFHDDLMLNFSSQKHDHHILNTAYQLAKEKPDTRIILVTKDVNLRMKAKSVGLLAQDYTSDHVSDINTLYAGKRVVEAAAADLIDNMYQAPYEVDCEMLETDPPLRPNEYLILKNHKKSALAVHDSANRKIRRVDRQSAYQIR